MSGQPLDLAQLHQMKQMAAANELNMLGSITTQLYCAMQPCTTEEAFEAAKKHIAEVQGLLKKEFAKRRTGQ